MNLSQVWDVILVGVLRGGMYSLIAIGLSMLLGVMSIVSMVNGELYMIGAYTAFFAFTFFKLPAAVAILLGAVVAFFVGFLIERGPFSLMRKRAGEDWYLNSFLLTVGLSFFLKNLATLLFSPDYKGIRWYWEGTLNIGGTGISIDRVVALGIAIVSIIGLELFLHRTQLGRAIRAVSQDERGAMLAGININNIFTFAFALACMMGGLAGASMLSVAPAYPYTGTEPNNYAWLVVMLAGLGNIRGAAIGGLIIGIVEAISFQFLGAGWPAVASIVILIAVLLFKPSGVFGSAVKGVLER
jgi:branched-chain amino acid transport system permease protein